MSWRKEKTKNGEDLVYDGVELGVAPSPTKGTANLQNVNIATETGEAMASFARFKQDQAAITNGTLTASVSDGAVLLDAPANLQAGQWITVSASTIPGATASADYLLVGGGGGGGGAQTSEASGGGGGGGVLEGSKTFSVGAHPVVVGNGGAGGEDGTPGDSGGESYIDTLTSVNFWSLLVGGGGGGATPGPGVAGGGGGAGGFLEDTTTPITSGTYVITVGAGGTANNPGSDSSVVRTDGTTIATATGGGNGGQDINVGANGGSGGGGGASSGSSTPAGGAGVVGQGNNGGSGFSTGSPATRSGGGGGGAGAVGGNAGSGSPGTGGAGVASTISGASVTYATGGNGNTGGSASAGGAGTANRGEGGSAGGGNGPASGGAGGSGVVILRFATGSITVLDSTGASSSTSGGDTILTWTTSGSFSFIATNDVIALGGGGGGSPLVAGQPGGSGGGGGSGAGTTGGGGASGQGNDGGNGDEGGGANEAGGGGGGAGAAGSNASGTNGGNGGNGVASSISGASVTYGGGGGGGALIGARGTGGTGGGGDGSSGPGMDPENGTDGLGGGGGGGTTGELVGGDGGTGVVIISYVTGTMTATGGAISFSGGNTIHTFTSNGTFTVLSIATSGQYFVSYKNSSNKIKLSAIYDPYGLYPIAHGTSGTATFSTLTTVNQAISKATEKYNTDDSIEYRYYILDDNGYVWVYDTQVWDYTLANNGVGEAWMLPDPTDYTAEEFNSIAILNGWLLVLNNSEIQGKPTVDLGRAFATLADDGDSMDLMNPFPTHTNFSYVGHQGKMYYCDGNYIGELFPTTSLATAVANVQTYAAFTGSGTTCTVTDLISGSSPIAISGSSVLRVPVVIFADETGSVPPGITEGTVYYAQQSLTNPRQFSLYTASSGGSALTVTTVGSGTYINTFYPLGQQDNTAGTHVPLFQWTPQRMNLPVFETAQCMVEIGNTVLIGGKTNTIYPWNQISALPTDLIALPETDVKVMINVNNMAYVFAGNKGNVYITNNSSASLVVKVPDYCAGVPGTPLSYIEPKFTWGDAVYLRGRVYFSILDQTATKAGNCGGVWSFVPTQNFYYGQDTGLQLRLENQNSYGNYSGMATILIANEEQDEIGPQYWAAWQNGYSEATSTAFGIDQSDDIPVTTFVIETDLIKVGTYLDRKTFKQTEFVLTSPLVASESVALYWRVNSTAAWTAFTNQVSDGTGIISGYYPQNLQASQWMQIRAVVTTNAANTSSWGRFKEIRVR